MHKHYYVGKGVKYDDSSTHMGLFRSWGFRLIHNHETEWKNLHKVVDLKQKTYIMGMPGHQMAVTVNQDLTSKKGEDGQSGWYTVLNGSVSGQTAYSYAGGYKIRYVYDK